MSSMELKQKRTTEEYNAELKKWAKMSAWEQLKECGGVRVVRVYGQQSHSYHLCTVSMKSIIEHLISKFLKHLEPVGCKVHIHSFLQEIRKSPELLREIDDFVASKAAEAESINAI